jgi:SAM-dependent methyltransferase
MTQSELEDFYRGEYRLHQGGSEGPTEKDLLVQAARARMTARLVGRLLPPVSHQLDLGSSSGALLETFRGHFGCEGVGIEPGEAYRHYSRERGLRVYENLAEVAEAKEGPFDLVTAMHVLEHLPDPVQSLARIRERIMTPEAYLLVEVPNLAEHAALERAHLHAFTPHSLKDAVQQAGFRVVWRRVHGSFRSPVLRLYITVLAHSADAAPPLRHLPLAGPRTRLGRRMGTAKREFFTRRFPDWTWRSPESAMGPA